MWEQRIQKGYITFYTYLMYFHKILVVKKNYKSYYQFMRWLVSLWQGKLGLKAVFWSSGNPKGFEVPALLIILSTHYNQYQQCILQSRFLIYIRPVIVKYMVGLFLVCAPSLKECSTWVISALPKTKFQINNKSVTGKYGEYMSFTIWHFCDLANKI